VQVFDADSRYYALDTATWIAPSGREVRYVHRRFLPQQGGGSVLARVKVEAGQRLDLITARALGDPEQFWRICDANGAMHPKEMTTEVGRWLVVEMPGA
jgi:hypothetical protein